MKQTSSSSLILHEEPALLSKSKPIKSSSFWTEGWSRFLQNKVALIASIVLLVLFAMAIIGPWINSYTYYETHLSLKNTAPCKRFWFGTDELG